MFGSVLVDKKIAGDDICKKSRVEEGEHILLAVTPVIKEILREQISKTDLTSQFRRGSRGNSKS